METFKINNISKISMEEEYDMALKVEQKERGSRIYFCPPSGYKCSSYKQFLDEQATRGVGFKSPDFRHEAKSISGTDKCKSKWRHALEFDPEAMLFPPETSRAHVSQGRIKNCFMVTALIHIAENKNILMKVFPKHQELGENLDSLIIRTFKYGAWKEVVLDQYVIEDNGLTYGVEPVDHCFYIYFLEKLYAMLLGSYDKMNHGGKEIDALDTLIGGVSISILTSKLKLDDIRRAIRECFCCTLAHKQSRSQIAKSLKTIHSYAIISIMDIALENQKEETLFLLTNPHGTNPHFAGSFAINSKHWKSVPNSDALKNVLKAGDIYITNEEFRSFFTQVTIVFLPNYFLWKDVSYWTHSFYDKTNDFSGKGRSSKDFPIENQFQIVVKQAQLIAFQIEEYTETLMSSDVTLGFSVFKIQEPEYYQKTLDEKYLKLHPKAFHTTEKGYQKAKFSEILCSGTYTVIPYQTSKSNSSTNYLLRIVVTDKQNADVEKVTKEPGKAEPTPSTSK